MRAWFKGASIGNGRRECQHTVNEAVDKKKYYLALLEIRLSLTPINSTFKCMIP